MKKLTTSISTLFLLSFIPLTADQFQNLNTRLSQLEQKRVVYPSASPRAKEGIHLFTSGEFLIWKMKEDGIPYAIRTQNVQTAPLPAFQQNLTHGKVENLTYDFDLGSRFTVGYNSPWDQVDIQLTWLRFFSTADRTSHAKSGEQLNPTQEHPSDISTELPSATITFGFVPIFATAKASSYIHLQQLDLDVGRTFLVGKWFNIRPHFGLRTTWLQQRLSVHYLDSQTFKIEEIPPHTDIWFIRKKVHWWGMGPEAGLDSRLALGKGFQLFGNLTASIEYGYHSLYAKDNDINVGQLGQNPSAINVKNNFRTSRPILDLQIGAGWDHLWGEKGKLHSRIDLGWEMHVYYSQNQFMLFVDDVALANFTSEQGDKTFQGLNVAIRLDY